MHYRTIRLILGDQLHGEHSWYRMHDPSVLYVLMEIRQETDYVRHHIRKIVAFFLAMRRFAESLSAQGHALHYVRLDDPENRQNLTENLRQLVARYGVTRIDYQLPDEYRLDGQLKGLSGALGIEVQSFDTEHFLTQRDELARLSANRKPYLMERFYRAMRRRYGILMEGDAPAGGKWNYDTENRARLPEDLPVPEPIRFSDPAEIRLLAQMIDRAGVRTLGQLNEQDWFWPSCREDALRMLDHFLESGLPQFGRYQDAMSSRSGTVFHSLLSFALNTKMLSPLEVVRRAEAWWQNDPLPEKLPQAEGFIRQILGWREYMRGVYWAEMPGFARANYFGHQRPLPSFYWNGETEMNCLRQAIGQSLHRAYAHHIQRLMITGNFALLAGVDPGEVDQWYLGIYADAIEWVEITNTRGMSQFADGGVTGTKPYVSSANYIRKMSDYCAGCRYDPAIRTGPGACPFNSLYWHFHHRHRALLGSNFRLAQVYRNWDRMDALQRDVLLRQAEEYLERIESL
jgi:deoxyribodipyrimidine photolyase-related protein